MSFQIPHDAAEREATTSRGDVTTALQTQLNRTQQSFPGAVSCLQPRCRLFLSAVQVVTTATDTAVVWTGLGQEHIEDGLITGLNYDNGARYGHLFLQASGAFLSPPIGGQYLIIGNVQWEANATGMRFMWLRQRGKNGTAFDCSNRVCQMAVTVASGNTRQQVSAIVTVRPPGLYGYEDGFSLNVHQTSGGDLDVEAGFASTYIEMIKLS